MGVPPFGGSGTGGWDQGYRDVYIQVEGYGGALHNYLPHSGSMPGYEEEAGIAVTEAVVITVGPGPPREGGGGGGGWSQIQGRVQEWGCIWGKG